VTSAYDSNNASDWRLVENRDVPEEVGRVLAVLPSASIVVDPDGFVVQASARSYALGLITRNSVAIKEIVAMVERVVLDSETREQEMRVRRPPLGRELLELRVRVAVLAPGRILILIDDLAEDRRVDAVRRDFVANVSHELKTPVGALSVLAEAVQSASDDADQVRHFAERMQVEASRLGHLIQDIIDLSRLQSDDPLLHAQVVNIDDVVHRAIEDVRTVADKREIDIVIACDPENFVYADFSQIQTALRNLLVNAIAYSSDGTSIAVYSRAVDSIVELTVKDQGVGIPTNDLDRIFERFYRVDPARSRVTGGTGLGLSIVKHVCQNHGGECTVWSEAGVGSSFTLRLPAYVPDEVAQAELEEGLAQMLDSNGEAQS
jgi:two-component system, OmpR family, sensor histidine kinase SenX3